MLSPTEFYPLTLELKVVLWIEAVVYPGIGIYELFDDFFDKPKPWMTIRGMFHTRKTLVTPFTYDAFREHCIEAEGEAVALRLDKLAGHQAADEPIRQDA